jgi:selenocysteine-specific elongation factor
MEQQATTYLRALEAEPYSPPTDYPLDPELLGALIDQGKVVKVNESVVFATSAYREMTDRIMEHIRSNQSITVADARTMFDSSRKYVLPLLEYLDQQRITRRVGDARVLRPSSEGLR